nr:bacteriohemerythrin [uncultured Sulfurimonas sp.]
MEVIDIFPWDKNFNTGLDLVDKQHKKLVEILNNLASHVAYSSSEKDLNAIFDELAEYAVYHFKTEEAIWHQYLPNDPLDVEHQAIHKDFVDTVMKLKSEQNTRPIIELAQEALAFLTRWLASHILETDRYMAYIVFALEDKLDLDAAKVHANVAMSGSSRLLIDIILSIYSTISSNTIHLMRELKIHRNLEQHVDSQDRYRNLLLELSTNFINLPLDEIDFNIKNALEKIAIFLNTDRAYIFDYNYIAQTTTNTYEWCAEGIIPQIEELQNVPMSFIPGWPELHAKGEYVLIQDIDALEEGPLREVLFPQGIKSLVAFPLIEDSKCIGFIGFDAVKTKHTYSSNEISILEIFSKLLCNITNRRNYESKLSHERTFLKSLFQTIPDLIFTKDINGVYLSCNSRFEDFVNAKEADIIGKTDYDFVDKSLADFFRLNDIKAMQSAKLSINEETVSFANDGHTETLMTTKVPMYDENNKLYGIMGVGRDITSIKEIQKNIEVEKNRFKLAVEGSQDGIWDWNLQTNELLFGERFETMLGYTQGSLKNDASTWFNLLHPEDTERASKNVYNYLDAKGKGLFECTFRLQANDGSWRWILGRAKAQFNNEGKALRLVGFNTDITEKKLLEEELKYSYTTLHKLTENIPGAIFQYKLYPDGSSSFPYFSKGIENIFDISVEDILKNANSILKLTHPEDRDIFNTSVVNSSKTMQEWNLEYRANVPKKGVVWIQGKAKPEKLEDGSILWHGVISDISARKTLELKYTQQAKIIDQIHDGVVITDLEGYLTKWNRGAEILLGYTSQEIIGKHVTILYLEKDFESLNENIETLMKDGELNIIRKVVKKSKEIIDIDLSLSLLKDEKDKPIGMIGYVQDITKRKQAENELAQQHKYMQSIIDGVDDPIMVIEENYNIKIMNESLKKHLHNFTIADPLHPKCYEVSHHRSTPCDGQNHPCPLQDVLETGKHTSVIHKHDTKDGKARSIELSASPLFNEDKKCIGIIEVARDITKHLNIQEELKKQKNNFNYQAHHDSLTGLPNRALFNDRLEKAIETAKRNKTKIALLFIDLDHFKEINDSLGHNYGDEILKSVSKKLDATIRDEDTLARLGGDEFTIILEKLSHTQDASKIANKILDALSQAIAIDDNILYVRCSIGISIYPDDGLSALNLLKFADSAMYKAKDEGRNNYQYYNSSMTELAFERVVMETSLRMALKNKEFVVFYQPQINGATDKLIGMEALVRWQHPTMGLVSPIKFISLAESTGLIVELGRYVMKTAMTQVANWYKSGLNPGILAINLTIQQLKQDDFVYVLQNLIKETGCKAEWLELEVTEGQIMTNPDEAIKILEQISDMGIELAIDDFGTGYSSLAYLRRLPIDKLKIDQAFIRNLPDDEEDSAIAKAIIALGQSLYLKVIAEGVETKAQKDFVVENGCENIQGYFYSKPLPASELEVLLNNGFDR